MESGSALSTYCRKCGQHFRIVRQQAPKGGIASFFRKKTAPAPASQGVSRQPSMPLQLAGYGGEEQGELKAQTALGHSLSRAPAEPQSLREVVCFDCRHHHRVSRNSTSSLCPNCGTYIDLRDVEIKERTTQRIRTRGDVVIQKKGAFLGTSIVCGNLTVHGQVSGSINASGDVIFKGDGKVLGEIRCRRIIIEKKVDLQLLQPVYAENVEIHGPVIGRFFASGGVLVSRLGSVNGSITGKTLTVEPGAVINGPVNVAGRREVKPEGSSSSGAPAVATDSLLAGT